MPQITFTDSEAATAVDLRSNRAEAQALPELLSPNERIAFVGGGVVAGKFTAREWLIVFTDHRLLCVVGTHALTRRVVEVPIASIRAVDCRRGPLRSSVTLKTGQGKVRISNMTRAAASELFAAVSEPLRVRNRARTSNPLVWGHGPAAPVAAAAPLPVVHYGPVVHAAPAHHARPVDSEARIQRLEAITESLESEVAQLREQVALLEVLLQAKPTH